MVAGRHPCQQRLAFEELLAHYLSLKNLRALADTESAPALDGGQDRVDAFIDALPFALTGAQRRVTQEILGDMAAPHPMMRLIQGDVGSGKTVVALAAMLDLVAQGYQSVMMAPTEVLAEQHFRTIDRYLADSRVRYELLAGGITGRKREELLGLIARD